MCFLDWYSKIKPFLEVFKWFWYWKMTLKIRIFSSFVALFIIKKINQGGFLISAVHRSAFCQFPFRWIYYYGSNKSTGKEIGKTHLSAVKKFKQSQLQCQVRKLWSDYTLCPPVVLLSHLNFVTQNIHYFPVGLFCNPVFP